MALKNCYECGKPVSTDARTCPHCGKRNPTINPKVWLFVVIIPSVLFGLWVFWMVMKHAM